MRIRHALGAIGIVAAATVGPMASSAEAATANVVDVTVSESLPVGAPGTIVADTGLEAFGCAGGTVETIPGSVSTRGPVTRFTGSKVFDCADGTLTVSFRAWVVECSTTDRGVWRVTGGTGAFERARGGGVLVGTYTGGAGNACDNTGIDDNYVGVVVTR